MTTRLAEVGSVRKGSRSIREDRAMEKDLVRLASAIVLVASLIGLLVAVSDFAERPSKPRAFRVIRRMGPFLG